MLSFKDWKEKQNIIKESALAGTFNLGVKSPNSIGISGANTEPVSDIEFELEEAKKKCAAKKCKKMDAELGDEEDAETAPDGEVVPKEKAAPKDLDAEEEGGEEEVSDEDTPDVPEEGDEDAEAEAPDDAKKKLPVPMLQKKKQKKQKKEMKKEETELSDDDKEFLASLKKMYDAGNPNHKFSSGLSEDALMTPVDPNAGLADMDPEVSSDPKPGEVGFAPDTKIGQ